ncbi:MAG TPA: hypothetical protein VKB01_01360, partial [Thermomicrobiales bacterium]|nr:hypothetical protein [Thermomicrobiales bacterium]
MATDHGVGIFSKRDQLHPAPVAPDPKRGSPPAARTLARRPGHGLTASGLPVELQPPPPSNGEPKSINPVSFKG